MTKKPIYHPQEIEKKWQQHWKESKTFCVKEEYDRPKYYILDMFPYPSGAGLHVGHVLGYTATDILARYKRQQGFNVLHPMGWDSFGLPAEQYAIKTGTHPAVTTQKNIENFKRQLQSLGFSYDWSREIATSDPTFYKWTQWIFTQLYQKGLAYEAEVEVNYCPALKTVLANEEIEEGLSKEGGHPVVRKPLRQWVLKITAYAERLLEDLKELDWPEHLKTHQENWIGKSGGVTVYFQEVHTHENIAVFTTRIDTLFGVSYLVLAPEHPLASLLTTQEHKASVQHYLEEASKKSDFQRQELSKEKTGVFTGAYAVNPATEERLPIWIADYVLVSYGTGAVMGVPGHDPRDHEFAKKHGLPIVCVIDPEDKVDPGLREEALKGHVCLQEQGIMIHSQNPEISLNGLTCKQAQEKMGDWLIAQKKGKKSIHYKLRDWLFSRQRYWGEPFPILHFEDGTKRVLDLEELPLCPPLLEDFKPKETGESPLAKVDNWIHLIDPKTQKPCQREDNTMPQWAGSCWYYLRFIDPHNEMAPWDLKKESYWMPVDLYIGGSEHAVTHLLYARFWHKVLYDLKLVSTSEPFKAYRNQGIITSRSYKLSGGNYVPEEEVQEKQGHYVHIPTQTLLCTQIEKMSKSKLNGVSPDEMIENFGADALRIYEMFMGPLEKEKPWNTDAVNGARRFLNRFFDMAFSEKVSDEQPSEDAFYLIYPLLEGVASDIERRSFNTAIAKLMEFLNDFTRLEYYPKTVVGWATLCLSPFAPHLAEEIWAHLKMNTILVDTPWPQIDARYLQKSEIVYVIQVNGKLRGKVAVGAKESQETIICLAKKEPSVQKYLEGKQVKEIFIPQRLVNFVTH